MQWTVRYFLYFCRKWAEPGAGTGAGTSVPQTGINNSGLGTTSNSTGCYAGTGTGIINAKDPTPGEIAYGKRKLAVWDSLVRKADGIFRKINPAYESPL